MAVTKVFKIKVDGAEEFVDLDTYMSDAEQSGKNLKTQLREINIALANLDETSDEFLNASKKAGELKDQLGDINQRVSKLASDSFKLEAFVDVGSAITSGFALAQGSLALFGIENENIEKTLLKVQSAIGILNGLQTVQNLLQKESTISLALLNVQKAIEGATESKNIIIRQLAIVTQKALNSAMLSNPIGLVIAGLVALGGALAIYMSTTEEATEVTNKDTDAKKDNTKATNDLQKAEESYVEFLKRKIGIQDTDTQSARNRNIVEAEIGFEKAKRTKSEIDDINALIKVEKQKLENNDAILKQAIAIDEQSGKTFESQLNLVNAQLEYEKTLTRIYELEQQLLKLAPEKDNRDKKEIARIEQKTLATIEGGVKEIKSKQVSEKLITQLTEEGAERRRQIEIEVNAEAEKIYALRLQRAKDTISSITQIAQATNQALLELSTQSLNNQIEEFEKQKEVINEQLSAIDEAIKQSADKQKGIEDDLKNARGLRREALINDLQKEKNAQEQAEKDRAKLEKDKLKKDEEIAKKRQQIELNQAKASVANTAIQIASQSALAIASLASQSAKQDVTFGIATIGSVVALGVALGVQIKKVKDLQDDFKFEKGGIIKGNSHSNGGVPIQGGRAEVEGGELIVNKNIWSRPQFVKAISEMNYQTGGKKFFADGGVVLPTPNFDAINSTAINQVDSLSLLRNDLQNFANRPVFVSVTDINNAQNRIVTINDLTTI